MADQDGIRQQDGFVAGSGHTAPPQERAVDPARIPGVRPPTGRDTGDVRADGHGGNPDSVHQPGEGGEGEIEDWHQGKAPQR